MNKSRIFSSLILLSVMLVMFGLYFFKDRSEKKNCVNNNYNIPLTLQSGEKGSLYFSDNFCEFPDLFKDRKLSLVTLRDEGMQENIFESKLYAWKMGKKESIEERVTKILKNKNSSAICEFVKNEFAIQDQLESYLLKGNNCELFGTDTEYSSEVFMKIGNILVMYRQEGADGIGPINFSSIVFNQN